VVQALDEAVGLRPADSGGAVSDVFELQERFQQRPFGAGQNPW
jgi:hypothetical protein